MLDMLSSITDFINDPVPNFFFGVLVLDNPFADSAVLGAATAAVGLLSQLDPVASAFTEVTGLEVGIDSGDTINEGGNAIPVKLPGRRKNDALTLKRYLRPRHISVGGFSLDPLTGWAQETMAAAKDWESQIKLKDIIVCVYHPQVKNPLPIGPAAFPIAGYVVYSAYPTKWAMSDLNSTSDSEPITETFEMSYREIERIALPPI